VDRMEGFVVSEVADCWVEGRLGEGDWGISDGFV